MHYYNLLMISLLFICSINLTVSESVASDTDIRHLKKITFDISKLNNQGLVTTPSGLVAIDYEFCIPAKEKFIEEVKKIDSSVTFMKGSAGRIGCSIEEYLCIGNTYQKNGKEILFILANLKYIKRIDMVMWE